MLAATDAAGVAPGHAPAASAPGFIAGRMFFLAMVVTPAEDYDDAAGGAGGGAAAAGPFAHLARHHSNGTTGDNIRDMDVEFYIQAWIGGRVPRWLSVRGRAAAVGRFIGAAARCDFGALPLLDTDDDFDDDDEHGSSLHALHVELGVASDGDGPGGGGDAYRYASWRRYPGYLF